MTIINMANARALRNAAPSVDIFFPVEEVPLAAVYQDGSFIVDHNRKAIVRKDTGTVIGVHNDSYHLITNREVFASFDAALKRSTLDLSGMKIKDSLTHGGARVTRSYRFPAHSVNVNKARGDIIDMELKVVNSYDGSVAFQSFVGGNRLVCENGMVAFDSYAQTYGKHTKGLDIDLVVRKVNSALAMYMQQQDYWKKWVNTSITQEAATALFTSIPGGNPRLLERLTGLYQDEVAELGHTVWAAYNALTYWATHEDVRASSQENYAAIQMEREHKVRQLLMQPIFKRLAA